MKEKKLPKKNSGIFTQDEDAIKKPGVKLSKSKRSKKPSIYDEMDDLDEFGGFNSEDSINDYLYDDDDDDLYWSENEILNS